MRRHFASAGNAAVLTLIALYLVIGGLLGHTFKRTVGYPYGRWTGEPVALDIGLGLALAIAAAVAWKMRLGSRK